MMKNIPGAILAIAILVAGCGDDDNPGVVVDDRVSDFSLIDVNPNSGTHDTSLSPRDYLGKVSAWYFGHST
jgi:hypothetical protein